MVSIAMYQPDIPQNLGAMIRLSACMGADPRTSVVNAWNQMHVAPNVYVTDGAFMSSGSCVNPTLTLMAFTARAANHAADQLRDGAV